MAVEPKARSAYERLKENKDRIVSLWLESCTRHIPGTKEHDRRELIDSLPEFLDKLTEALNPASKLDNANQDNALASFHGLLRLSFEEYDLKKMMEEYEILYRVIKSVLNSTGGYTLEEYETFSESIWRAMREAAFAFATSSYEQEVKLRKQFELIIKEVRDYAIFMIDPDGYIRTWNEGAKRIKQYEEHEIIGKHFRELYLPEDREEGRPERNLALAKGEGRHSEQWWRMKKDGTKFWAHVSFNAVYDKGKLIGLAKVVHDLTEKKESDEEMRKARQAAEEANSLKTAFLANMSHEIRTPLNAILGFTELLKSEDLPNEEKHRYIDIIDRNGRSLVSLIDDILDISKVEAGKLVIEKILMDLRYVIAEVSGLFEGRAREKGLEYFMRVDTSVPNHVVADPVRVRQILNNIIGNAIKFTEAGSVVINVEQIEEGSRDPMIHITVTDTGPGIPKDRIANLFEPFVQADPSTTRRFGGTGLGLALSRRLARQLGGDVKIGDECVPHKGCVFHISFRNHVSQLPSQLSRAQAEHQDQGSVRERPKQEPTPRSTLLTGKKVLLVEDSDDNRALVSRFLARAGADVTQACDGAQGVDFALSKDFDIVVMDVQMPVLDGNDACKKLRDAGFKKPIIALTAHAMKEEIERCFASGFTTHISKPVESTRLVSAIAEHTGPRNESATV